MPIQQTDVTFADPNYMSNKGAARRSLIRHCWQHINDNQDQYANVTAVAITDAPHTSAGPDDHMDVNLTWANGTVTNTHFPVPKSMMRKKAKNTKRKQDKKKKDGDQGDGGAQSQAVEAR